MESDKEFIDALKKIDSTEILDLSKEPSKKPEFLRQKPNNSNISQPTPDMFSIFEVLKMVFHSHIHPDAGDIYIIYGAKDISARICKLGAGSYMTIDDYKINYHRDGRLEIFDPDRIYTTFGTSIASYMMDNPGMAIPEMYKYEEDCYKICVTATPENIKKSKAMLQIIKAINSLK